MLTTLRLNKCSIKYLIINLCLSIKKKLLIVGNQQIRITLHLKFVKRYPDDVILTSALRLSFCLLHAILLHLLRSSTFLDILKLLIVSFSQLVSILFYVTSQILFPVNIKPASLVHVLTVQRICYICHKILILYYYQPFT